MLRIFEEMAFVFPVGGTGLKDGVAESLRAVVGDLLSLLDQLAHDRQGGIGMTMDWKTKKNSLHLFSPRSLTL